LVTARSAFVAPLQPILGAAAVVLAAAALVVRVRAIRRGTCPLPAERQGGPSTPYRRASS
jgi:hypothetical protein